MLRILFWKIGFEWANIKRIIWPDPERKIWYFAFGANLDKAVLEKRRIHVFESFDYALANAELRFTQLGFYRHHGYASADPANGAVIYGKMYLLLQQDADRMDYFEGVPFLQVHQKIYHDNADQSFFYYRAMIPREGLKPTQEYLGYITKAYREMPDVPAHYLKQLEQSPVLTEFLPQDQTGDFVRHIEQWPKYLHPLLTFYEGLCLRIVEFFWNRSLFQWMIKAPK
ncbi:MAG: gamma-glutamylcyclotransferase [Acidiferrobacterales bacterium]|nr:gamma-glutamylcyclotransferase [Acidiferrobacterales bacterium]